MGILPLYTTFACRWTRDAAAYLCHLMKYVIPTSLETERLTLRMFRESDWRDLHEYYGDQECTTYTSGRPLRDYETWQKLAALVGHWELRAYGSYALEEKASGKVMGVAGLDYPVDWPEPEI